MPTLTAMLKTVSKTMASPQPGFRTISSKVFCGENSTPNTRLIALIWGCGSGAAGETAVVVAIGKSSTTRFEDALYQGITQGASQRFRWADSSLIAVPLSELAAHHGSDSGLPLDRRCPLMCCFF